MGVRGNEPIALRFQPVPQTSGCLQSRHRSGLNEHLQQTDTRWISVLQNFTGRRHDHRRLLRYVHVSGGNRDGKLADTVGGGEDGGTGGGDNARYAHAGPGRAAAGKRVHGVPRR